MTKARDAVEDFVRGLGPHKRLRGCIGDGNVAADGVLQFSRAAVNAAPELLFGERREPALLYDLIRPQQHRLRDGQAESLRSLEVDE